MFECPLNASDCWFVKVVFDWLLHSRQYRVAKSYASSPELRVTWLGRYDRCFISLMLLIVMIVIIFIRMFVYYRLTSILLFE